MHVDTPDYRRCSPWCGQQLIVQWNVPRHIMGYPDLHLLLHLRFRNHQRCKIKIPLSRWQGYWVYRLLNEEYVRTDGVLTYRLELRSGDRLMEAFNHQVWTRFIDLDEEA